MSYYDHLMLLRDAQAIILEQQLWWADLHLGKGTSPSAWILDKTSISLMPSRWGRLGLHVEELWSSICPGHWDRRTSPSGSGFKEDSHLGWRGRGILSSSFHKGASLQSPGAGNYGQARGGGGLTNLFLKEHFRAWRIRTIGSSAL